MAPTPDITWPTDDEIEFRSVWLAFPDPGTDPTHDHPNPDQ